MTKTPLERALTSNSSLPSQSGFSLLEVLVSIGLVGLLVAMNAMMMGNIFNQRHDSSQKHDFDVNAEMLFSQLENADVCNGVMQNFGPGGPKLETLVTPAALNFITPVGWATPIIEKDRPEFKNTLFVKNIVLSLSSDLSAPGKSFAPVAPFTQYPFVVTTWLTVFYEYQENGKVLGGSSRQFMYDIFVTRNDDPTPGAPPGGHFLQCMDASQKYKLEAKKALCLFLGLRPDIAGTCDLKESNEIRQTACHLTGFAYGGRYCDITKPSPL